MLQVDSGDSSTVTSHPLESGSEVLSVKPGQPGQSVSGDSSILTGQPMQSEHPGLTRALQILQELSPRPRSTKARTRKRKAESAAVITSSPYKQQLECEASKKNPRIKAGRQRVSKGKTKSSSSSGKRGRSASRSSRAARADIEEETEECLYCHDSFSDEGWIQCQICSQWAHDSCAGVGSKCETFVCELCDGNDD